MPDRIPSTPVRARAARRRCLSLACLLALFAVWSGPASAEEPGWRDVATPLRLVNLNPFHLMYGVPSAYGARVLAPGSSEAIASVDMASHLRRGIGDTEQVLIDGETYRQALALRYGFQPGWEFLLEVSAVSHSRGHFDGFIENWHDFFGLPQSGRDTEPRNRLEMVYVRDGEALVDIDDGVSSLGDMTLGVGYELPSTILANDGLVLRSTLKLPTGDEGALAGSGGLSASVWAETSGSLSGSAQSRDWLYTAALGFLVGEPPEVLSTTGGQAIVFGQFGVTWRPLTDLSLTVQVDIHSSPYGDSGLAPLADPAVIIGLGGSLALSERTTLEVAVTEDDGSQHSAPDTGLHVALRWRP